MKAFTYIRVKAVKSFLAPYNQMRLLPFALLTLSAVADQPIMNMMPRWDGGYGFQLVQEYRTESELLDGKSEVGNGLSETVNILHLEGVYTWDRSVRLTAKLPFVLDAEREILDSAGNVVTQEDSGVGDLTLALPIKSYFNETDKSGSWTAAPQLRVPLRDADEFDVYDRVWGVGLSLGYEQETQRSFFAVGVSGWFFEGEEPDELQGSFDLGWNFDTRGQLLLETDFEYEFDGSYTLKSGPALYYRITDIVHARLDWKYDLIDKQNTIDHGKGQSLKASIGFVW